MTIKLTREDALVIKITDAITSAMVDYDKYANLSKEVIFKDDEELHSASEDKLYRYFGPTGLRGYIVSEINEVLLPAYAFNSKVRSKPLREYKEFSNPVLNAKQIVSRLKQLPERVRITAPLSTQFSAPLIPFVASAKMGEAAALCRPEKLPSLQLESDNNLINDSLFSDPFTDSLETERTFNKSCLYFTSIELGYAKTTASSPLFDYFLDKIRSIYGAMNAMGVISEKFTSGTGKKPFVLMHRENTDREIISTVEMPDDIWDRRWHQSTELFVSSAADKPAAIKSALDRATLVLQQDDFGQRASTACIWYYRALSSTSLIDRILHATIAIEVLVGDKETADSVGLTKLLGNRCAYLLGKTRQSRQAIVDEFVEIYRVRSSIVHGGKHKLDRKDRSAATTCLRLCASLISRELELHQDQESG